MPRSMSLVLALLAPLAPLAAPRALCASEAALPSLALVTGGTPTWVLDPSLGNAVLGLTSTVNSLDLAIRPVPISFGITPTLKTTFDGSGSKTFTVVALGPRLRVECDMAHHRQQSLFKEAVTVGAGNATTYQQSFAFAEKTAALEAKAEAMRTADAAMKALDEELERQKKAGTPAP